MKIFIDGSAGTTGLRIADRLKTRDDIELSILDGEARKDVEARRRALNEADIAFLCLPDDAARESVSLVSNPDTVIIDTSTAHRVSDGWTYGFPEIAGRKAELKNAKRIANPGCHASGFISLVAPLVEKGIIKNDAKLSAYSLTGYSGGGKKMITQYEEDGRDILLDAPRTYGLGQKHKHLPEMSKICGLENAPIFCPIVAPYYAGMEVVIPLFKEDIAGSIADIEDAYEAYYKEGLVHFVKADASLAKAGTPLAQEEGFISAGAFAGRDDMQLSVFGNEDRALLVSRFDNLGKGASGSAIQNMNIVMGVPEDTGLNV